MLLRILNHKFHHRQVIYVHFVQLRRWTVRTGAIESIITNYSSLCKLLDEIHESSRDEYSIKAAGLLTQLEKFGSYFGP